jgi:REP element-mobilizing transposase RayT
MAYITSLTPRERRLALDEVLRWHQRAWTVHAVSVIPDHVHILATPLEGTPGLWYALPQIMQRVKGRASYEINKRRGRRGTLWQDESYDRIIRGSRDFDEKYNYILSNAGVAGLVGPLEEYDGFWCEGMEEIPESAKATPERPLRPCPPAPPHSDLPLGKRVPPDVLLKARRRLPHWQLAGSTYFVVFCLLGRLKPAPPKWRTSR